MQRFAKLVASGMRQTDARIAAFGDGWPSIKRSSHSQQASRLMQRPDVRAAVAEYTEQLMPLADVRAVAQEMERSLYYLALHSPNDRVRLQASQALIEICERREQEEAQRRPRTVNVDALINELAELAPRRTLELETVDESVEDNTRETAGGDSEY
jgi:hypothetical protein